MTNKPDRRMLRIAIPIVVALLAGCEQKSTTPESSAISDAQAVAAVKAAQDRKPPLQPVVLEPVPRGDIDRYNLHDSGCNLTRAQDHGDPLVIVNDGRAMIRIDGEMLPLAADVGGVQLGARAWQYYVGKKFALSIKPVAGASLPAEGEAQLRDAWGRVVFATTGMITCAA